MMAVLYCWMKVLFQKKHLMGWNVSCHQSRRNLKETTIMLHKSKCHCNERQSPSTTIHAYLTMYCASRYASWVGAPSHDNSVHGKYPFFVVSSSSWFTWTFTHRFPADSHVLNVHIGISAHDGTWIYRRWQRDCDTWWEDMTFAICVKWTVNRFITLRGCWWRVRWLVLKRSILYLRPIEEESSPYPLIISSTQQPSPMICEPDTKIIANQKATLTLSLWGSRTYCRY